MGRALRQAIAHGTGELPSTQGRAVIAIVSDTGGANLASVINAFARLGHTATLTGDPAEIAKASHVILPGVGAAGDSMARLRRDGLVDHLAR